jgi:hypothetical protein
MYESPNGGELENLEFFGLGEKSPVFSSRRIKRGGILSMTLPGEEAGTCERRMSGSFRAE